MKNIYEIKITEPSVTKGSKDSLRRDDSSAVGSNISQTSENSQQNFPLYENVEETKEKIMSAETEHIEYEITTFHIGNSVVRVHRPKLSESEFEKRKKTVEDTLTRVGRSMEERKIKENKTETEY